MLALESLGRHGAKRQRIIVGRMRKWTFRMLGAAFIVAAVFQYISFNMPNADGSDAGALTLLFGWVWTCLIALPGMILFALSKRD